MSTTDRVRPILDEVDAALTASQAALVEANKTIEGLRNNLAALAIEFRDYRESHPDVVEPEVPVEPPVPPKFKTYFGACPMKPGGSSITAARTVTAKWGKGAAVRLFAGDLGTFPWHEDFGLIHVSYKPAIAGLASGSFDAAIRTMVRSIPAEVAKAGRAVVEVWHESDKKVNDGLYTYAQAVAGKNRFYDVVKATNPDVLVANTVTGWLFDPRSGGDVNRWGAVKADIIGIDCDGVRPTTLPYTNYEDETKTAVNFVAKFATNGYKFFAVPEFGCPRVASDASGAERARYHELYANLWASKSNCLYVTLYEYDSSPNYSLTTPAEIAQWKSLIG